MVPRVTGFFSPLLFVVFFSSPVVVLARVAAHYQNATLGSSLDALPGSRLQLTRYSPPQATKDAVVKWVNSLRKKIQEDENGPKCPADKMPALVWDQKIADTAQVALCYIVIIQSVDVHACFLIHSDRGQST